MIKKKKHYRNSRKKDLKKMSCHIFIIRFLTYHLWKNYAKTERTVQF